MAWWLKVGFVPGLVHIGVSSLEGKNCRKRESVWLRSTIDFSRTIELYWSAVVSIVLALSTTSCCQEADQRARPGSPECSGVRHSAAMTFSLLTQIPVEVLSARLWLPNTCPGVLITATPGPSTT